MMETAAKIGPNAIIQLGETFAARNALPRAAEIYARAGCRPLLDHPPDAMTDESIVARLFLAVAQTMEPAEARDYFTEAGTRTGDYILANRIPALAQRILAWLPRGVALKILLKAIAKHSWTFAGSGAFAYEAGAKPRVSIADNPIATPLGCAWHAAVFSRIFSKILHTPVAVTETSCCGHGAERCTFDIHIGQAEGA